MVVSFENRLLLWLLRRALLRGPVTLSLGDVRVVAGPEALRLEPRAPRKAP